MVSLVLSGPIFGISMEELALMDNGPFPKNLKEALEFVQTLQAIGLFIVPVLIFSILHDGHPLTFASLDRKPTLKIILTTFLIMVAWQPIIDFLARWNESLHLPASFAGIELWMREAEDKAARLTEIFLDMPDFSSFIIVFLVVAVLPALGEEMLFRGGMQNILEMIIQNKHLSIWITAFLFSALHFQFFGFIPRFIMGLTLGYLYLWSGTLWVPIAAHLTNNGMAVIFTFLFQHGFTRFNPEPSESEPIPVWILLGSVPVLFFLMRRMAIMAVQKEK